MGSWFVILLAALSIFLPACRSVEVKEVEKQLFVRAQDLSEYGVDLKDPGRFEKFNKTRYIDGSIEIEYEFEPNATEGPTIYLVQTISIEKKSSDAKFGKAAEDAVIGLALKAYGVEKQEVPNFYKYGDASNFYALKKDGVNVGNYFNVRDGGKVFSFFLVGVYFDDPNIWREVVENRLKAMTAYTPQ